VKGEEQARLRTLLDEDRVWCAYALADLEPPLSAHATWNVGRRAVALLYRGLQPPFLFLHGDPLEVDEVTSSIPDGTIQYGLLGAHRAALRDRLSIARETRMWRMVLHADELPEGAGQGADRLASDDAEAIEALFASHPDRPDTFLASQLDDGVFYGVRIEGELASVAGTHAVVRSSSLAAIGNVFTRPDARHRGLARRACAAVAGELVADGLTTIVLNVAMGNDRAVALYRSLGFWPFCGYYEGVGALTSRRG
jgi:ribosomal protein S18 acetylase RimI-like enzyme